MEDHSLFLKTPEKSRSKLTTRTRKNFWQEKIWLWLRNKSVKTSKRLSPKELKLISLRKTKKDFAKCKSNVPQRSKTSRNKEPNFSGVRRNSSKMCLETRKLTNSGKLKDSNCLISLRCHWMRYRSTIRRTVRLEESVCRRPGLVAKLSLNRTLRLPLAPQPTQ